MINTVLLKPRNLVAIAFLAVVAHLIAAPIYKLVDPDMTSGD